MPDSLLSLWPLVIACCIGMSIAIFGIERWMTIRFPQPLLGSWPRWLRPTQTGWMLLNVSIWLGLIVMGTECGLPSWVGLPLIALHAALTVVLERRHAWETSDPADTE